ncbi:hypothetical protein MMC30_006240 [Trapelia coarctata]|nr:hypothetical protein [Trapelia coarctata]
MGQSSSKARRESTSSQAPLNPGLSAEKVQETFYSSANPFFTDAGPAPVPAPLSTITRPAPPPRMHRVSELIDPYDLLGMASDDLISIPQESNQAGPMGSNKHLPVLVESPSGRTMEPQEFLNHPNRPLAIRERQESILKAVEAARNGSVGTGRNASVGSNGTYMTFEQRRIEEGRLAYEKTKMKGGNGRKSGCGCFSGCFGGKG